VGPITRACSIPMKSGWGSLSVGLSMIFPENRIPLFGIMLPSEADLHLGDAVPEQRERYRQAHKSAGGDQPKASEEGRPAVAARCGLQRWLGFLDLGTMQAR